MGGTQCEESTNLVVLIIFPLAFLHLFIKRWIIVKSILFQKTGMFLWERQLNKFHQYRMLLMMGLPFL